MIMYFATAILNGIVFLRCVAASAVTCSACPSATVICEGEFKDRYYLHRQLFLLRLERFVAIRLSRTD